jgi:hypothetical protein
MDIDDIANIEHMLKIMSSIVLSSHDVDLKSFPTRQADVRARAVVGSFSGAPLITPTHMKSHLSLIHTLEHF